MYIFGLCEKKIKLCIWPPAENTIVSEYISWHPLHPTPLYTRNNANIDKLALHTEFQMLWIWESFARKRNYRYCTVVDLRISFAKWTVSIFPSMLVCVCVWSNWRASSNVFPPLRWAAFRWHRSRCSLVARIISHGSCEGWHSLPVN